MGVADGGSLTRLEFAQARGQSVLVTLNEVVLAAAGVAAQAVDSTRGNIKGVGEGAGDGVSRRTVDRPGADAHDETARVEATHGLSF
jgi:hypothetical protein